ncbi:MAG: cyclophilin-like fold protein [Lachnospiraceae bacterium]
MKKILKTVAALFLCAGVLVLTACGNSDNAGKNEHSIYTGEKVYAHCNDRILEIELADNPSAEAFYTLLKEGSLTINMYDYGRLEKVGSVGEILPTNNTELTAKCGDVMLYEGSQIMIYYDSKSWSFTRLGRISNVSDEELKKILGDSDIKITFSCEK